MTDLRTATHAFLNGVKQNPDLFTFHGTDKLSCAVNVLHDVFNDAALVVDVAKKKQKKIKKKALVVDVEHETRQAQASCTAVWTQSISYHAELIEKACPKWELYRETLADDIPIRKEMVNKFPAYGSVGELSAKLKEQLNFVKAIQSDGFGTIVDPNVYKKGRHMVDFGVESVAFAFFLRNHCLEFPTFKNVPMLAAAVHKVRAELRSTRVTLTSQMQKLLDQWEDGTLLQHPAPQQHPAPATYVKEASYVYTPVSSVPPPEASSKDGAKPASSGVKRPSPDDGAPEDPDPEPFNKSSKLRDLIAGARRKNIGDVKVG